MRPDLDAWESPGPSRPPRAASRFDDPRDPMQSTVDADFAAKECRLRGGGGGALAWTAGALVCTGVGCLVAAAGMAAAMLF